MRIIAFITARAVIDRNFDHQCRASDAERGAAAFHAPRTSAARAQGVSSGYTEPKVNVRRVLESADQLLRCEVSASPF